MIRSHQEMRLAWPSLPPELRASKLTIFAIPKPFEGHIGTIQKNAIRSWAQLQPHVEILLMGSGDPQLASIASEVGARVVDLECNANGTPLLSHAFRQVHRHARTSLICYANCDLIFGPRLLDVCQQLENARWPSFLAIGQRTNLEVLDELDMADPGQFASLEERSRREGKPESIVCKDYFLFPHPLFQQMPEFLVGRGNWDNWMVAEAKNRRTPVVDVSPLLRAIHQHHDHTHVSGGRKNAYIFGDEARINQRLAGGRHLVRGSTADWELTEKGPVKRSFPTFALIRDLPRFLGLLRDLLFLGYLLAVTSFSN